MHIVLPYTVDLSARVYRHDNSSIQLDWFLPRELQAVANELVIEVKVGGAWVPIQPGHVPHIPANLSTEHRIQFRLRLGNWEGHSLIIIPPQTTPTSSTPTTFTMETEPMAEGMNFDLNELGLIYGFIFGLLILTCASVVFTILVLKYVQMNRREDDKGIQQLTNYSHVQLEFSPKWNEGRGILQLSLNVHAAAACLGILCVYVHLIPAAVKATYYMSPARGFPVWRGQRGCLLPLPELCTCYAVAYFIPSSLSWFWLPVCKSLLKILEISLAGCIVCF